MSNKYSIVEVNNKKTERAFLLLPVKLYENEKNWIRPLDNDIKDVFNLNKNKSFRHGEAIHWILVDQNEKTIGRVAAFYEKKKTGKNNLPTGGMGFFECINDQDCAFMLFNKCKEWLNEKGMQAMDGPVNFGNRDRWWGLLVDGFYEPNYCMPYNFGYYQDFFENYGFKNYFNQYTYNASILNAEFNDAVLERAERISRDPDYTFSHFNGKDYKRLAEECRIIYNNAWTKFQGVKEMRSAQAIAIINGLKPVLDKRLFWFGYHQGKPIAFLIIIPELNQIIKHLNGKMNLLGKIKFLYYKKIIKTVDKALGILFGIVQEYQSKGIDGAIVMAFAKVAFRKDFPYKNLEMNWIGDFNPSMMKIVEQIGGKIRKTHITYRYLFDRNIPFKRASKVN